MLGKTKTRSGERTIVLPRSTAEILRRRKENAITQWIFPDPVRPELPLSPNCAYTHMKAILMTYFHFPKKAPNKPAHKLSQQDIENLQIVAAYLSDHYAFDIPLERLTQIACMGTTKLKSCFKKYYDCTITEYVQQRRMSQAEYLLAYTELTVGQVAQTVGYSTSSRFAELFRKSTGLLPLEYRKNAQRK